MITQGKKKSGSMSVFRKSSVIGGIEPHIKDFIVECIRKGEPPRKIKADIASQYGKTISKMAIFRTRKTYMELTGEYLKSFYEFHGFAQYRTDK